MSTAADLPASTFDRGRAVTKALLGWGVVAGPFYVAVGLAQALLVPGFDLSRHALSQLLLGPFGWIQAVNLVLSGLMVLAAAIGYARLVGGRAGGWAGSLLGVYGASLFGAAVFPPDPVRGFPAGAAETVSTSGLLHLACGAVGFLCLAAAAIVVGRWFARTEHRIAATWSTIAAVIIVAGFIGGAALATATIGIALLWIAVLAGWTWLAAASVVAYRAAPSPDC
ncbi:DUF998 domain-containing protein [Agromyces sp. LHK192]|uniref:DUF998 domain-containing protein n=1 Tax=Agromyces sp. LHK192 TaxID=2498704 RepID=UPI000FD90998|nr:DUF998 domain-containing protein [Agromyces sp. LHK192]